MVPEWIMEVIEFLLCQLVCRFLGHRPGTWYPTQPDTEARLCGRCFRTQRQVLGVSGPWRR